MKKLRKFILGLFIFSMIATNVMSSYAQVYGTSSHDIMIDVEETGRNRADTLTDEEDDLEDIVSVYEESLIANSVESTTTHQTEFERLGGMVRSLRPWKATRTYQFVVEDMTSPVYEEILTTDGGLLYEPHTPKKEAYRFLGWFLTENGQEKKLEFSEKDEDGNQFATIKPFSISGNETVQVKAKFEKYREIKFYLKLEGKWIQVYETYAGDEDTVSIAKIPLPLKIDEQLEAWYYDENLSGSSVVNEVKVKNNNINLYGKVVQGAYLKFDVGEFSNTVIDNQFVRPKGVTRSPDKTPQRLGYHFQHWTAEEQKNGNGQYTGQKFEFGNTLPKNTTLHAVWQKDTKVKYIIRQFIQKDTDDKLLTIKERSYIPHSTIESEIENQENNETLSNRIIQQYLTQHPAGGETIKGYHLPIGKDKNYKGIIEFVPSNGLELGTLNVYYSRNKIDIKFKYLDGKETVFSGLYLQKIDKYEYKWPSEIFKESTGSSLGKRIAFLDIFKLDGLAGVDIKVDDITGEKTESIVFQQDGVSLTERMIYEYLESIDNKYELSIKVHAISDKFTIIDKYLGFHPKFYTKDLEEGSEKEQNKRVAVAVGSDGKIDTQSEKNIVEFKNNIRIFNQRNKYDLKFLSGGTLLRNDKVKYEASLAEYADYIPQRTSDISENHFFDGWYMDQSYHEKAELKDMKMPYNTLELYAKWSPKKVTIRAFKNLADTDSIYENKDLEYGNYVRESMLPTVMQGNNIIVKGSGTIQLQVPEGTTWGGWYIKNIDDQQLEKYDFNSKLSRNVDFYPYYIGKNETVNTFYYPNKEQWKNQKDAIFKSQPHIKGAVAVISGIDEDLNKKLGDRMIAWSDGKNQYLQGDEIMVTENLHLYPLFAKSATNVTVKFVSGNHSKDQNKFVVADYLNNGTVVLPGVLNSSSVKVQGEIFEGEKGYRLLGWLNSTDNKLYQPGDKLLADKLDENGENILTAKWEFIAPWGPSEPSELTVTVLKHWIDKLGNKIDEPSESIKVQLLTDGNVSPKKIIELNEKNNWTGKFENLLSESRVAGEKFNYTVKEVGELDGFINIGTTKYMVIYDGNMKDGFTITNKQDSSTISNEETPKESNKEIPSVSKKETSPEPHLPKSNKQISIEPKQQVLTPEMISTSTEENTTKEINNTDKKQRIMTQISSIQKPKLPKTGDERNLFLYVSILLVSGSLLVMISNRYQKNER